MSVQSVARHRAARRPSTPLTAFGEAVAGSAGQVGRRSVLVAATSGLALTMVAPTALAAPESASLPQVDVSTLAQQARAAMNVSPTVVVPAEAQWAIAETEVAAARPAPPPVERPAATTASRSGTRTATSAVAPAPIAGSRIMEIAYRYIGVPYVSGGMSSAGLDCSGFTALVYQQLGITLPRSSAAQRYAGTVVPASQRQVGDLMWWPGHVGLYAGNDQYIGARSPGVALKVSPIYDHSAVYIRVTG